MIRTSVLIAMRQLRRNVVRSLLTMLGIVIGVGAVIALVTLGKGVTAKVTGEIGKLGDNMLIVQPGGTRRSSGAEAAANFEGSDVDAIVREVPGAERVAPTVGRPALVIGGNRNWRTNVVGTTLDYLLVRSYDVEHGRAWNDDDTSAGPVCLLGSSVKRELFGAAPALDEVVRIETVTCRVVGVLAAKGGSGMGQDQDDVILLPLKVAQRRLMGSSHVGGVFVTVAKGHSTARAKAQIESLLRERRRVPVGEDDDFSVRDMAEIADTVRSAAGTLTALLGAIAAVSLLVGGIGIMNIMLVNVTERTREIGIRLAVGALARDVLTQFLVEAAVLSTMGGLLGIGVGFAGSWATAHLLAIPFVFAPQIMLLAFAFSGAIGVLFGYLPARKAARLNPIEALRHE